jgi:hypothetical protein
MFGQPVTVTTSQHPWAFTYATFTGTLPNPSLMFFNIEGTHITMRSSILPASGCVYTGPKLVFVLLPGGVWRQLHLPSTGFLILLPLQDRLCPSIMGPGGLFDLTPNETLIVIN